MRMKSLILIFIALGCGLVASIGISQVMNRDGGSSGLETEQILVTLSDIDIGTKLDAKNVKLEDWPRNKVPEGAIRRLEDVKDKYANARFYKGEPLHGSKVTDQLGGNFTLKIQEGYRVMPVKVEEDTVMKGISPGDRVDVIVFLRRNPPEIMETGAFPILKNVRVFAVNTNTERASDAKGETTNFRTVSLLIKDEHTGELVVAARMGNIYLTLRRPDETDAAGGEEVTPIKEILSGGNRQGSEPNQVASAGPTTLDFVKNATSGLPASRPSDAPYVRPVHSLVIMDPTGRKQFDWSDANGLPTETVLGPTNPLPAPPTPAPAAPSGVQPPSPPEGSGVDHLGDPTPPLPGDKPLGNKLG
jgi:pilus assembly protein CpaB